MMSRRRIGEWRYSSAYS